MIGLSECIEWRGTRTQSGYGQKYINGKRYRTHRLAWEWAYGPIPEGILVLHHCDNPPCCNPNHLFLGTQSDNMRDCAKKGRLWAQSKTHCPQGHEYVGENLKIYKNGRHRYCLKCKREHALKTYHRRQNTLKAIVESGVLDVSKNPKE